MIMRGEVKIRDMALSREPWPEREKKVSNAFDNQFQLPVLFYVGCVVAVFVGPTWFDLVLAWAFVVTRYVHAVIHVTDNHVIRRFWAYTAGLAILTLFWLVLSRSAHCRIDCFFPRFCMKSFPLSNSDVTVSSVILGLMRIKTMSDAEIRTLYSGGPRCRHQHDRPCRHLWRRAPPLRARFGEAVTLSPAERDSLVIQTKTGIRKGFFDFSKEHILKSGR